MALSQPIRAYKFPGIIIKAKGVAFEEFQSMIAQFSTVIQQSYQLYRDQLIEQNQPFSIKEYIDLYGDDVIDHMKTVMLAYNGEFREIEFSEKAVAIKVMSVVFKDDSENVDPTKVAFASDFESYIRISRKLSGSAAEGSQVEVKKSTEVVGDTNIPLK